uniref:VP11 n=1 Tax=viral metagenome TaxID=1070528 RepID=A0A6C0JK25_9ZZZZ
MSGLIVDLSSNELREDGEEEQISTEMVLYKLNNMLGRESNIDKLLKQIRHNCVHLSIYHNRRYHFYKNMLFSIFRVPLIVLGGMNSYIAVGLQSYLAQSNISLLNAMLSLLAAIITSLEILLNLQKRMENELESHKSYYKLSFEIYNFVKLDPEERGDISSKEFFATVAKKYATLVTTGNAINVYRRGFKDKFEIELLEEDEKYEVPDAKKMTYCEYFSNGCI